MADLEFISFFFAVRAELEVNKTCWVWLRHILDFYFPSVQQRIFRTTLRNPIEMAKPWPFDQPSIEALRPY